MIDLSAWREARIKRDQIRDEQRIQKQLATERKDEISQQHSVAASKRNQGAYCLHFYASSGFAYRQRFKDLFYNGISLEPVPGLAAQWAADVHEGQTHPTWLRQVRCHLASFDCPTEDTSAVDALLNPVLSNWMVTCILCSYTAYPSVDGSIDPRRIRPPARCPQCGTCGMQAECIDSTMPSIAPENNNYVRHYVKSSKTA